MGIPREKIQKITLHLFGCACPRDTRHQKLGCKKSLSPEMPAGLQRAVFSELGAEVDRWRFVHKLGGSSCRGLRYDVVMPRAPAPIDELKVKLRSPTSAVREVALIHAQAHGHDGVSLAADVARLLDDEHPAVHFQAVGTFRAIGRAPAMLWSSC